MTARHFIIPTYVVLCLTLGGASAEGWIGNIVLQVVGALIIGASLMFPDKEGLSVQGRRLFLVTGLVALIGVLQLVPLPPEIWTKLPGRQQVAEGLVLLGIPLPWSPISLAPKYTAASLLWILPGFAIVLGMLRLRAYHPALLIAGILLVMIFGVILGALQVSAGSGQAWYPYRLSNFGRAVGFFANANHMANFLVLSLPMVGALLAWYLLNRRRNHINPAVWGTVAAIVAMIAVGIFINESRAGYGLAIPGTAAAIGLVLFRRKTVPRWGLAVFAITAIAFLGSILFEQVSTNAVNNADSRPEIWEITGEAALGYFPIGSGSGTFMNVYFMQTDPSQTERVYINHAHNDYLEIFLETGLVGMIVLALFLLWWTSRVFRIWNSEEVDVFARLGTILTSIIMLHSAVDYPMRTAALVAVFAVGCVLMAYPRYYRRGKVTPHDRGKHLAA